LRCQFGGMSEQQKQIKSELESQRDARHLTGLAEAATRGNLRNNGRWQPCWRWHGSSRSM
jgi:hypothetical protein